MTTNGSNQSVVTITLTGTNANAQTDTGSFKMVWTPSSAATDLAGNATSTAAVTEATAAENF
jgi:hypothetical protein